MGKNGTPTVSAVSGQLVVKLQNFDLCLSTILSALFLVAAVPMASGASLNIVHTAFLSGVAINTVPVPSSFVLMVGALVGAGVLRFRSAGRV